MKKKMLSLAFLLRLCLTFLPGSALALSNETFEYTLSGVSDILSNQ